MAIESKYNKYIHCDVKDTREDQTGHNYRLWIDKWRDDILTFDVYFYDLHNNNKMVYHTILIKVCGQKFLSYILECTR